MVCVLYFPCREKRNFCAEPVEHYSLESIVGILCEKNGAHVILNTTNRNMKLHLNRIQQCRRFSLIKRDSVNIVQSFSKY